MKYLELLKPKTDSIYYRRYCALVLHYMEHHVDVFHKHHIAPRKMFPEFISDAANIVKLPPRAHYIAHYLLAKFSGHSSQIYAFNMMRKYGKNSRVYDSFSKEVAELISKANSGRPMSDYNKAMMSKLHRGMVNARDSNGMVHRIDVNDERLKSGEFVNALAGRRHSSSTKQLISANGIKGTKGIKVDGVCKYKYAETDLVGKVVESMWDESRRKEQSAKIKDLRWITEDGVSRRVKSDECIGKESKRIFNNPFSKDNMLNKAFVYCLKEKRQFIIDKDEEIKPWWINRGTKTTKVYVFENIVGIGGSGADFFKRKFKITGSKDKKLAKKMHIEGMYNAGVVCYNLPEFDWKEEYILWNRLEV